MAMVNSSASKLSTVSHTLSNTWVVGVHGSIAASGVRSRNNEPCANSMKIAGQRDTSGSAAAAPELIGREPGVSRDDAGGEQEANLHRLRRCPGR